MSSAFRVARGRTGWIWFACLWIVAACRADVPVSPSTGTSPEPSAAVPSASAPATGELGAAGVLAATGPSLAFIATETSTGSGMRLDDRHILTNAHVVRLSPASVRVQLPDARSSEPARVVRWDLVADLAVLEVDEAGPLQRLATRDAPPTKGERVYLIGYPLADPNRPTTTITEGIVSGDALDWIDALTYYETDATIEDGQSGGVLVDDSARLLGITGGSRGAFAVALDARDALARTGHLLAGQDVDGLDDRLVPAADPSAPKTGHATIQHRADAHVWIVDGTMGDPPASVSMTADGDVGLYAMAAAGQLSRAAGPPGRKLRVDVGFDAPGPYMVKVEPADNVRSQVQLRSTAGLTPLVDPDDGRALALHEHVVGVADYAGDLDWYLIALADGQTVTILASAAALDPALFVDRSEGDTRPIPGHDSGGPLGNDDEVTFTAPAAGDYLVVVSDLRFSGAGAYRLTVEGTT